MNRLVSIKRYIPLELRNQLSKRLDDQAILGLEGLENCIRCDFAQFIDDPVESNKVYSSLTSNVLNYNIFVRYSPASDVDSSSAECVTLIGLFTSVSHAKKQRKRMSTRKNASCE
jgi:hypothetical protein